MDFLVFFFGRGGGGDGKGSGRGGVGMFLSNWLVNLPTLLKSKHMKFLSTNYLDFQEKKFY